MRIGVLTFHRAYNCGAQLQAWALQTALERLGHQVRFPDINEVGSVELFPRMSLWRKGILGKARNVFGWTWRTVSQFFTPTILRYVAYNRFIDKNIRHVPIRNGDMGEFDLLIAGSDQVWNPTIARGKDFSVFTGEGLNANVPMIGYALSAGDAMLATDSLLRLHRAAQERFRAVSYREAFLRDMIKVEGPVVCDPTLLLGREDYRKIECKKTLCKGDYLFAYCVNSPNAVLPVANELAKRLGVELVSADVVRGAFFSKGLVKNDYPALTPDKMLALIRDAKYVVVSSFHGCVMSIIYQKNFVNIYEADSVVGGGRMGRQQSFLQELGLSDRRWSTTSCVQDIVCVLTSGYDVREKVAMLASSGYSYLKKNVV